MVNIKKTGKNKIIVVAYPLGRIGSSAVMGLLQLSGVNVGVETRLIGPGIINPKGFFELKSQQQFLERTFKDIYPGVSDPPSMEYIDRVGKMYHSDYDGLIHSEFGNRFPIAVKSQRFLTLSFLYHLKEKYDIRVLVMQRNVERQVQSILRVWRKKGDSFKKEVSVRFVLSWLQEWQEFATRFINAFDFRYHYVSFEAIMEETKKTTGEIFRFIEETCPTFEEIDQWLDHLLVNRRVIK